MVWAILHKIGLIKGRPIAECVPADFRVFLLHDMAKWADVVKKSGAKVD